MHVKAISCLTMMINQTVTMILRLLQGSLALWVPAAVFADQSAATAQYLILEFWRGTVILGASKLRIAKIKQAAASLRVVRRIA